jgi:hypothetical protein
VGERSPDSLPRRHRCRRGWSAAKIEQQLIVETLELAPAT